MTRTAWEWPDALWRVVLIQINRLLHEQRVLVQALLLFLSLMCCHDVTRLLGRQRTQSVVLWVAKHPQDRTRADWPVVSRVHQCSSRARGVGLPHRVVVLGRRLRPVVGGVDKLVVGASIQQIRLDVLHLQLVGVTTLLQGQILTTIFAH